MTRLSVSLGLWLDRPPDEVLHTAEVADACGYPELWVGEMATYDAFALATAVGLRTRRIALTVGPLAVTVRDPVMIARGAASVAGLTRRRCGVALGTSSPHVVEGWHGRSNERAALALRESAVACRQLLAGERGHLPGRIMRTAGFRLRLPPPGGALTIAAFGPAAVRVAADHADRMVVNLVSPDGVAMLRRRLTDAAGDRELPSLAVWVPVAVDPGSDAFTQLRRALVAYLSAPGYAEMLAHEGGAEVVGMAREGAHPRELAAAIPEELVAAVCAVGSSREVTDRIDAYAAAGADEVVVVPSATDDDPAGEGSLRSLEPLA